jgi:hypothetical protein
VIAGDNVAKRCGSRTQNPLLMGTAASEVGGFLQTPCLPHRDRMDGLIARGEGNRAMRESVIFPEVSMCPFTGSAELGV